MAATNPAMRFEHDGRILVAAFNNPPENRLNIATFEAINKALDLLDGDDVDLLIFTGSGSVFSKGFDMALMQSYDDGAEMMVGLKMSNGIFSRIARSAKPVIAAINGHCLGGGLEMALACHFRLCVEKTRLGLPEVWNGIIPGLGCITRLSRLVGQAKALELIALGDLFTSDEAYRLNVVNRLYPRDNFMSNVLTFAKALLVADQKVTRELIGLVARTATQSEDDSIKECMDSFVKMVPWLKPSRNS